MPGIPRPVRSQLSQSRGSLVCVCVRSVLLKKRTKPKTTRPKTAQTYRVNKFGLILMQSAQIFRMFADAITRHRTKDPHINILKRLLRTHFMISWFLDWTSTHEHDTTITHASIMTCCPLVIRPKVKMGTKNLIAWTRTRYCDHAKIWNERSDHTLQYKHARWSNMLCLLGDWRGKCLTVFEHLFPPPLNTRQSYRSAFRSKTS